MPLIVVANSLSVAANATSANLFAGNLYEYLERPSVVEFGMTGSAAGLNATIYIGGRIVAQDVPISAANRYPIVPDDWVLKAPGPAMAKLFATFRNTTAGALNLWCVANVTPVA